MCFAFANDKLSKANANNVAVTEKGPVSKLAKTHGSGVVEKCVYCSKPEFITP